MRYKRISALASRDSNLIYDLYSKDLSVKVKASLERRKAQGMYISSHYPFGYEKSANTV